MIFPPHSTLPDALNGAATIFELATELGKTCLDNARELDRLMTRPANGAVVAGIEKGLNALEPDALAPPVGATGYGHLLSLGNLGADIAFAAADSPLEHLAVLRGLCRSALPDWYEATSDRFTLDYGMPVEFPSRSLSAIFRPTPWYRTLTRGGLLDGLPYSLYRGNTGADPVQVRLDYSTRERLDDLAWRLEKRLPRVATLHPHVSGGDGLVYTASEADGTFFGVYPSTWSLDWTLERLARAAEHAEIAVLPELCLPADGMAELHDAIQTDPHRYPALVVAGSAHVGAPGGPGLNESHVFLDGRCVATHRKIHPFATRELSPGGDELTEGISGHPKEITVLCGQTTKLAVVICADLNDDTIPGLLEAARVNLLLVPSMTFDQGAFNGAICGLASRCQGAAVVVNADLDGYVKNGRWPPLRDGRRPFRVLAAVPRPESQSASFPRPWRRRASSLGVLDANKPLRRAMRWLR